MGKTKTFWSFI